MRGLLACALLGALATQVAAMPPLPDHPRPGQRPLGMMKRWLGQMNLLKCEYDPPTQWDDPKLVHKLYGRHFDTQDTSGSGSVVVLGAHNSGTSITTRLIMLLGAFSGNYETLSIHHHNKLKYYEPLSVSLFHDSFLGKFVDTRFRPYHGQNLDYSGITDQDRADLDCFARKHVKDMNRHQPWVMKDPRMALAMPLWRKHIPNLVCIIVHKDPIKNSMSLASNGKKSSQAGDTDMMTPQRWLNLWGETMKQGLEGCRGAPTIVFRSTLVTEDTEAALAKLKALLERAGVRGLHMPDPDEIQREIKDHIRSGPREFRISRALEKKLGLDKGEKPVVDTTVPVMSAEQGAIDQSLLQHADLIEGDAALPLESVVDRILELAGSLESEGARRSQEFEDEHGGQGADTAGGGEDDAQDGDAVDTQDGDDAQNADGQDEQGGDGQDAQDDATY